MWSFLSSLRLASLATSLIEGGKVPLAEGDVSVADRGRAKLRAQALRRAAKPPSNREAASSADADMEKLTDTLTIMYVNSLI